MEEQVQQLSAEEQQFSDSFMVCPHCGSKLCYKQTLPDGVESYTCMACGFTTSTLMVAGSETEQEVSKKYPTLYKDLKFKDPTTNLVWYPAVVTVPGRGMVYIDGSDFRTWSWAATPMRRLTRRERRHGPYKGQEYIAVPKETQKFGQEGGFVRACAFLNLFGDDGQDS